MTLARIWTVVSTNWLRESLNSQVNGKVSRKLRVLDTSFLFDPDVDTYKECYKQGHIPQSLHFNMYRCVNRTPERPVNLPDINCFTDYAQELGIWPDTHVITYDRFGPAPAYRTWWLFRTFGHKNISILDGGLRKWLEDGHEVTTEETAVERSNFEAKLDKNLLRSYEDVLENLKSRREQLVDARNPAGDSCTSSENYGGVIPGAKHIVFEQLFTENGTIKSDRELKELFDSAGVDLGQPITASCLRGLTACGVAAAAHILGKEHVPVYAGSWWEYSRRAPDDLKALAKKAS
ncbi:thiosulfate sulfurtransferase-like [Dreissena polymorpha]|uniref:Sulfurtransferase n=1 Tax=Dreissena polymorpha TaxID=45954 RepID=A0A9D4L763_DREPO|nr:thiosulfate sulfurtransferase-like [Dreissena polymorpha]XP_052275798.1 thiosulfate sulfurtransferase-like [Dreissena polymorpha]KAH3852513.1 hypothetical protein DPMN_095023 [Dreissena polymorpha]